MREDDRFIIEQNGNYHTVRDTVDNVPLGMFEFEEDEFPVYACFHMIIDRLNEYWHEIKKLHAKNEELKHFMTHSEAVTDQKELQKIIYKMIHDLLDEKMKENQPLSLTCYIPQSCEHRHACHENHQKNTASMARYAMLKELKEELPYE